MPCTAMTSLMMLMVVAVATVSGDDAAGAAGTTTACPTKIVPVNPPVVGGAKGQYTTKYDSINVDMILRNERLLKNYVDCLMERKPCSREGALLKEIIPDALQTECSRCSDKQKQIAGHIMSYLLQYKKKYWDELLCKYDPKGTFRQKYEVDDEDEED